MIYSDFRSLPKKVKFVEEDNEINFYGLRIKQGSSAA